MWEQVQKLYKLTTYLISGKFQYWNSGMSDFKSSSPLIIPGCMGLYIDITLRCSGLNRIFKLAPMFNCILLLRMNIILRKFNF